jgi:hypothetical protein
MYPLIPVFKFLYTEPPKRTDITEKVEFPFLSILVFEDKIFRYFGLFRDFRVLFSGLSRPGALGSFQCPRPTPAGAGRVQIPNGG